MYVRFGKAASVVPLVISPTLLITPKFRYSRGNWRTDARSWTRRFPLASGRRTHGTTTTPLDENPICVLYPRSYLQRWPEGRVGHEPRTSKAKWISRAGIRRPAERERNEGRANCKRAVHDWTVDGHCDCTSQCIDASEVTEPLCSPIVISWWREGSALQRRFFGRLLSVEATMSGDQRSKEC